MKQIISSLLTIARGTTAAISHLMSPGPVLEDHRPAVNEGQNFRDDTDYKVGEELDGIVTGAQPYGIFIRLPNGESGLVFKSEICWAEEDITYGIGHRVTVSVLGFKAGKGLSLSIRQAQTKEAYERFSNSHSPGEVVHGYIKIVLDYGVFVRLAPGVDGLLHVSAIPGVNEFSKSSIGKPIDVRVTAYDKTKMRISLGLCS